MDVHLTFSPAVASRVASTAAKRLFVDYHRYVEFFVVGVMVSVMAFVLYGLLFASIPVTPPSAKVPVISQPVLTELSQWRSARAARYQTGWVLPDHDYFVPVPFKR